MDAALSNSSDMGFTPSSYKRQVFDQAIKEVEVTIEKIGLGQYRLSRRDLRKRLVTD
jgi:hypothetical protein